MELMDNIDKLHTTELGLMRIKRNLSLDTEDVVTWCKEKISSEQAVITRDGKNWYIKIDSCVITVNAYSYTIITAHKEKKSSQTVKGKNQSKNCVDGEDWKAVRFDEVDALWKRIFELEWESLCNKSKVIAAIIVDEQGHIISEGRNKIGENVIPNPRVSHAETEAVRNLDISKYPKVKSYTLYAALEPCPMCLGTLVMGGIRKVILAAHDAHGGAMELIGKSHFLASKQMQVTWMPPFYGDMQRGLQTIKELLYNEDKAKLEEMLSDFSVYNLKGVNAAKKLVATGILDDNPRKFSIEDIFNRMSEFMAEENFKK